MRVREYVCVVSLHGMKMSCSLVACVFRAHALVFECVRVCMEVRAIVRACVGMCVCACGFMSYHRSFMIHKTNCPSNPNDPIKKIQVSYDGG